MSEPPVLTGDTYVTMEKRRLTFNRLPSAAGMSYESKWSIDLSFDCESVAMHPPMNVVAVSEHAESSSTVRIHLLEISTGKEHPFARNQILEYNFENKFSKITSPVISISKTTVAVMVYQSDEESMLTNVDELIVWNWRTGVQLVRDRMNYNAITLFSDTWLVAGHSVKPHNRDYYLYALYLIDTSAEEIQSTHLELEIPVPYYYEDYRLKLHSGELAPYNPNPTESDPGPPSLSDKPEAIITALLQHDIYNSRETAILCINMRISELLILGSLRRSNIVWDSWKHCASIFNAELITRGSTRVFVSGRRLVWPLKYAGDHVSNIYWDEFKSRPPPQITLDDNKVKVKEEADESSKAYKKTLDTAEDLKKSEMVVIDDTLFLFTGKFVKSWKLDTDQDKSETQSRSEESADKSDEERKLESQLMELHRSTHPEVQKANTDQSTIGVLDNVEVLRAEMRETEDEICD